jgi:hypothetical protein
VILINKSEIKTGRLRMNVETLMKKDKVELVNLVKDLIYQRNEVIRLAKLREQELIAKLEMLR